MVTFYANPDDEHEIWIEKAAFEGANFRVWHYIFFCVSAFTVIGKLYLKWGVNFFIDLSIVCM